MKKGPPVIRTVIDLAGEPRRSKRIPGLIPVLVIFGGCLAVVLAGIAFS